MQRLGKLEFLRERTGEIGLKTYWSPTEIAAGERAVIASELESVAAHLRKDQFEVDGRFKFIPSIEQLKKNCRVWAESDRWFWCIIKGDQTASQVIHGPFKSEAEAENDFWYCSDGGI